MPSPPLSDEVKFGINEAIKHLSRMPHSSPICAGPSHYQTMPTCAKCLVIVGLRNLRAGREYYADPTPT